MRELHIIDESFVLHGVIAHYGSLQINRSHYGVGDFELHVHPGETGADALAIDRIIFPVGEPRKAMLIESVERRENTDDIAVSGRMLKGLTARRVCVPPASASATYGYDRFTGAAESVLHHYIANNITEPEDTKRRMGCVTRAEDRGRGINVPWEARFEPLDELLGDIAAYADMGWDIVPELGAKRFAFGAVPGRDFSQENDDGRRVTFAVTLGNATVTAYTVNAKDERTTAYVGGSGEDENRIILAVGADAQGLARREMWVDAGSQEAAEDLQYEGTRKLSETKRQETITCEVIDAGPMRYGRDWDLGDLVTVTTASAQMSARIVEIAESYEKGGAERLSVTFGDPPRGIAQKMRSMTKKRVS